MEHEPKNARTRRPGVSAANIARTIPCTDDLCRRAFNLTLLGLTRAEVAERLKISGSTFDKWLRENDLFRKALQTARESTARAAAALARRAEGMTVMEEKAIYNPRTGKVEKHKLVKEIPPSEVVCMMVLTNRDPEHWRWRSTVDHTNSDGSFRAFADAMGRAGGSLEQEFLPPERRLTNAPKYRRPGQR